MPIFSSWKDSVTVRRKECVSSTHSIPPNRLWPIHAELMQMEMLWAVCCKTQMHKHALPRTHAHAHKHAYIYVTMNSNICRFKYVLLFNHRAEMIKHYYSHDAMLHNTYPACEADWIDMRFFIKTNVFHSITTIWSYLHKLITLLELDMKQHFIQRGGWGQIHTPLHLFFMHGIPFQLNRDCKERRWTSKTNHNIQCALEGFMKWIY